MSTMSIEGKKMTKQNLKKNLIIYTILILFSAVLLLPFIALISTSFKTFEQAVSEPANLIPTSIVIAKFSNYKTVLFEQNYITGLFTSFHISLIGSFGTVFSASLVAYAFARFEVKEKDWIFSVLMFSAMIPGQVLTISMYEMYINLGWLNTYFPFWIPPFLGGGIMNVFLIRQFFLGIPKTLYEAAEIDGASYFGQYIRLAIPLSVPVLLTVFIFTFTGSWNDFMTPLLFLSGAEANKLPLSLLMYRMYDLLKVGDSKQWNVISAGNILMMLPIIILFIFTQKYFIEGVSVSGIKQ